jgi:hypothetical protein
MKPIEEYLQTINKPILLAGKGPTFKLKDKILLSKYSIIAFNHAITNIKADACSIIDIDVVGDLGDVLYDNAKVVLLPWHPHVDFKATDKTLEDFIGEYDVLKRLDSEGRLYYFNLSSTVDINPGSRVYPAIINSGDTIYNILAANGTKTVYTIGIDGGNTYSDEFAHIIPLQNGRDSFDDQNPHIERTSKQYNSEFIRLGDLEEVNVYVGSTPDQLIPSLVLEYSIKKNTHHPSTVTPLHTLATDHRMPVDDQNKPRTPFSFKRFFIPELASGKAFYLDSDMIVFGDMGSLLEYDFDGHEGLCCAGMDKFTHWKHSNFAMLLFDCDNIEWTVDEIIDKLDAKELTYEDLMFDFSHAKIKPTFEYTWNSLDDYEEGKTMLLHYTDMMRQPWKYPHHPHERLWMDLLKEAVQTKFIDKQLVIDHGNSGAIRKFR